MTINVPFGSNYGEDNIGKPITKCQFVTDRNGNVKYRLRDMSSSDGETLQYGETDVTYKRSGLKKDSWYTLCLPFGCSVPEGMLVEQCKDLDYDNNIVTFAEVKTIEAGKPYLMKITAADKTDVTFEAAISTLDVIPEVNMVAGHLDRKAEFVGVLGETVKFDDLTNSGDVYYGIGSQNTFQPIGGGVTCSPFHAYLRFEKSSKAPIKVIHGGGDGTTGISSATSAGEDNAVKGIYNLNGQRMAAPRKGINIINGKKVIVK